MWAGSFSPRAPDSHSSSSWRGNAVNPLITRPAIKIPIRQRTFCDSFMSLCSGDWDAQVERTHLRRRVDKPADNPRDFKTHLTEIFVAAAANHRQAAPMVHPQHRGGGVAA